MLPTSKKMKRHFARSILTKGKGSWSLPSGIRRLVLRPKIQAVKQIILFRLKSLGGLLPQPGSTHWCCPEQCRLLRASPAPRESALALYTVARAQHRDALAAVAVAALVRGSREDVYNILWAVVFGFATFDSRGLAARRLEPRAAAVLASAN